MCAQLVHMGPMCTAHIGCDRHTPDVTVHIGSDGSPPVVKCIIRLASY